MVKSLRDKLPAALTFVCLFAVVFCFVMIPILDTGWMLKPFIGSFLEHGLIVANRAALDFVPLQLQAMQLPTGLQRLSAADPAAWMLIPYFVGWVFLASSLYVFGKQRNSPGGRVFALFSALAAVSIAALFGLNTTGILTLIWAISIPLLAGALFNLAFVFPREVRLADRFPFLPWIGYGPAFLLIAYTSPILYNDPRQSASLLAWRLEYIFLAAAVSFLLGWAFLRRTRPSSPSEHERTRVILIGAGFSFAPVAGWLFLISFWPDLFPFTPFILIPLVIFPLVMAYAVTHARLSSTDLIFSRAVLYLTLSGLAAASYVALVSGLSLILDGSVGPANPLIVGFMVFLLAVLLNPVRTRLQRAIDSAFFRGQMVDRSRLQEFGQELSQVIELPVILRLLRRYVDQDLQPLQLHIFVHDPLSNQYLPLNDEDGQATTDVRFPPNNALVNYLFLRPDAVFLEDLTENPDMSSQDLTRLALLDCQLFVPLAGQHQLVGWLALGARRSAEPYTRRNLNFLGSLSKQASLAVEKAQFVAGLERRLHEMNVLTRVAQGINFTVSFDDILELIYAQTNQVIPVVDFRVLLFKEGADILYYAFYLENDERLAQKENQPLGNFQSLEMEVLKHRRGFVTDDYERECRQRGFLPDSDGYYAWMGVPLSTGSKSIGTISLASRDPAVIFTEEQRNLLQAIADQATGAIVKARLLRDSESRTRQLAMLNEIGRDLTSTLDIRPLLDRILKSAIEILNCEAGSLFLVDQQTGELVFEVVDGPVAADLVGRRLPPGKGVVGEAVEAGRAIIANDAKRRKEWFDKTDQQTGFSTQDLLVVPMQLKERVIGVIEAINKVDGSPFTLADQELLTTFASQATIAIENARLYTMTDQALADRVEELSVMQRIDRELNASLDVYRAMRITLTWAMGQSGAEAGLVGIVEDDGVRVTAAEGYSTELAQYMPAGEGAALIDVFSSGQKDGRELSSSLLHKLPIHLPALRESISSGQPQCFVQSGPHSGNGSGEADFHLLVGGRTQTGIPIRRETDVIGVLLLESKEAAPYSEEVMAFLSRLSDHAAIAISNAQLYGEVEAANLAKSKFVSFVAHELKNPMSSIKGYTELVAGGMAGPVTEMQTSFLNTIRSNVDRMNTIVSDLNDLTKIQVGALRLEFKAVKLQEMVDEVIRSLNRQLEEKEQTIEFHLSENLPLVWGDPMRLSQVLMNLVSNATKYTPRDGCITIGAEVETGDTAGMEFVHLWVQDTGIGIPLEDQPMIFQQYFRTEISKETASGTGLGLNISKSLIEMQGGRMWFESQAGKGSIFHFAVPIVEAN